MNEKLIANANFRIWTLNGCWGEMECKNNTRRNSAKGEQVWKIDMWH